MKDRCEKTEILNDLLKEERKARKPKKLVRIKTALKAENTGVKNNMKK